MNTSHRTTANARFASVALAALLTLATLSGVNSLAAFEAASPIYAQAASHHA